MFASLGRSAVRALDDLVCGWSLAIAGDRPTLLGFSFHAVARRRDLPELDRSMDPTLAISLESFDAFVDYFLQLGYRFVGAGDVVRGLPAGGRYVMATFDDGYRNNLQLLPVIRSYGVPVTLFVSTNHLAEQRAYWWDVVYRERAHRGAAQGDIVAEQTFLKTWTHDRIHAHIVGEFGPDALEPVGPFDCPMTVEDLREVAQEPLVHIGNHTADHAVLTSYAPEAARAQIELAQSAIEAWTGERPVAIAYPNGDVAPGIVDDARLAGLRLGMTLQPRRNRPRSTEADRMSLGRFLVPRGVAEARKYSLHRSPVSLRRTAAVLGSRWS